MGAIVMGSVVSKVRPSASPELVTGIAEGIAGNVPGTGVAETINQNGVGFQSGDDATAARANTAANQTAARSSVNTNATVTLNIAPAPPVVAAQP